MGQQQANFELQNLNIKLSLILILLRRKHLLRLVFGKQNKEKILERKPEVSKNLLDSIHKLAVRIDTIQIKRRKHLQDDGNFPFIT